MKGVKYLINGKSYTEEEYQAWREANKEKLASRFREMLESGKAPSARTDREFLMGHCCGNQFEGQEYLGDHYARIAKANNVDITGRVYMGSLARFPGDPEAWVSGKGDAEAILDKRGWGAEGMINRPVKNVAEPEKVAVDPSLVQDEVDLIVEEMVPDGERQLVDRVNLAEQVFNRKKGAYNPEGFEPAKHCPEFAAAEAAKV
jgi:hypothetical protein